MGFQDQTQLPYAVYDVFTDRPFGGNPLAVVFEADDLSTTQMQTIAREFNFSESVFLARPKDPKHSMAVRIFTPARELPFAGHPTIGAAVALSDVGYGPDLVLELGVGQLPATAEHGAASFLALQPVDVLATPETDLVSKTLRLDAAEIATPPIMASMGVPFTFTALASKAALSKIDIDETVMKTGRARYPESKDFAQAAYWRDAQASQEQGHDVLHLRMFAPLDGIPEDPATGSAVAALANLLYAQTEAPVTLRVHQGHDMGRPSYIEAHAGPKGVRISGSAVQIMQGKIRVG